MWFEKCVWSVLAFNLISFSSIAQDKKVVFIIVDGIPASELERVATPNLDEIAEIGGFARGFTGGEKGGYSQQA